MLLCLLEILFYFFNLSISDLQITLRSWKYATTDHYVQNSSKTHFYFINSSPTLSCVAASKLSGTSVTFICDAGSPSVSSRTHWQKTPRNEASPHDSWKYVAWLARTVQCISTTEGLVELVSLIINLNLINYSQCACFDFSVGNHYLASRGANISLAKTTTAMMADESRYFQLRWWHSINTLSEFRTGF